MTRSWPSWLLLPGSWWLPPRWSRRRPQAMRVRSSRASPILIDPRTGPQSRAASPRTSGPERRVTWKQQVEAASAGHVPHCDLAPMGAHDALHNGQPEAGAARAPIFERRRACGGTAPGGLEDAVEVGLVDAAPRVDHRDHRAVVDEVDGHRDG